MLKTQKKNIYLLQRSSLYSYNKKFKTDTGSRPVLFNSLLCGHPHWGADGINDRWVKIEYEKDKYGWFFGGYVSVESYAAMEGRTLVRYREAVMEAKAGTPERRWRKGTDGRISQARKW